MPRTTGRDGISAMTSRLGWSSSGRGAGGGGRPGRKGHGGPASLRNETERNAAMEDTPSNRSSAISRFKPYAGGRIKKFQKGTVKVAVTGHTGGRWNDFTELVSTTTPAVVSLVNVEQVADTAVVTVKNAKEAQMLTNLSGMMFAGNPVHFRVVRSQLSNSDRRQGSATSVEKIREVLISRYDPGAKYLNLDKIADDPKLNALGVRPFAGTATRVQAADVIFKMANEMFPDLETLSLASNRLRSAHRLQSILIFIPNLKNISLKNNRISTYRDLEPLSGPPGSPNFKALRELLLDGNPLKWKEVKKTGDELAYRSEITRRFPSISLLDGRAVAASVSFDIVDEHVLDPSGKALPVPLCGGFFDSPITKDLAENFVRAYLNAYDGSRHALLDAYDSQATFSLTVCEPMEAGGYSEHNRNLRIVKDLPNRLQSLYQGNQNIIRAILSLSPTSHAKALDDSRRLCVDAWQLHGLAEATSAPQGVGGHPSMFVHVHGEFLDVKQKTSRSFDRTFTLAPSDAGSLAQTAGWPVVILSDILTVRQYAGFEAWQPEAPESQFAQPGIQRLCDVSAQEGPQASDGLNEDQRQLAAELGRMTGLNRAFSVQCLADNAWKYDAAVARFNELRARGTIPREAFAT